MAKRATTKARPKSAGRKPKSQDLPGMEDRAIAGLETLASEYAEIRDQRMALNKQESGLKDSLLKLMKQHSKTRYHRDGIDIEVVPEGETVKVRLRMDANAISEAQP